MNHLLGDDAIGALQGGFDIALARSQFVSDVVAEAFMNHRAALSCGFDIHNRREFFVININQMHRVGSRVLVSRHDGRNWMTDEQGFTGGEHAIIRHFQIGQSSRTGHCADFL